MRIPSEPARFLELPATTAVAPAATPRAADGGRGADAGPPGAVVGPTFGERVSAALESLHEQQAEASRKVIDLATGQDVNVHDAVIAMEEAGLSFKLMVQVRNKALEAYQEVMRTQV